MNLLRKIASLLPLNQKIQILILMVMTIFLTVLELLSISSIPILISAIISDNVDFINSSKLNSLISQIDIKTLCFLTVLLFIIKNLLIIFYNYFNLRLNYKINITLSKKIFQNYICSDYLTLSKIKTSDMIRNLTSEVAQFVACVNNLNIIIKELILLVSLLVLIVAVSDLRLFTIFIIFIIITSLVYFLIKGFLQKIGAQTVFLRSKYIETITDSFQLIKEIIINSKRNFFINKYFNTLKATQKNELTANFIFYCGKPIFEILAIIMIITIILIKYEESYNAAYIISYLSLIGVSVIRCLPLFNSLLTSLNTLQYKKPAVDAVIKLIKFTENQQEEEAYNQVDEGEKPKIIFNKSIKIKNLSFAYDQRKILNNLSIEIKKGEKIGLIGSSGSGKTTLINILSGLIKLKEEKLFIDDMSIKTEDYKEYRKIVSLMPQETYLMNESIHNNIIFGASDYNNDLDIQDILETVNIKDFADKLILKENEIITQDGSNISGGEKQRVIFGRSLFKDFELLILDEPTSSLDKENSYEIINSIFKKYSSKTIIIVTHKIDPRLKFDRVLNMSYGKIE